MTPRTLVVLVGHGAPATDCPRELVSKLKALEGRRRASGAPLGDEERALDEQVRRWPRTPQNDPYREGLFALAETLRPRLGDRDLEVAFNELCAPSIEEVCEAAIARGARRIVLVTTMVTRGGIHAEGEIPETVAELQQRHPEATLRYAWPFGIDAVADLLADRACAEG